ncbi:MAG: DNA-processing protein DprA [Candidatus Cryptobacteroides sp.]
MGRYDERICLCALNRIFGYAPSKALALLENIGPADRLFEMGGKALAEAIPYFKGLEKICDRSYENAERELEEIGKKGCDFIGYTDSRYPRLLRQCPDASVGLYVKGNPDFGDNSEERLFIAVIGTRDISEYGKEWCSRMVRVAAGGGRNVTIVSGLAYGTDITAHRTALQLGAATIGVMATGIDAVYPWRHHSEAEVMSSTPGCALITDYPSGTAPVAANFLRRNRIIAGMSDAVVLVESKIKGGGMMTARLAFSYDRDVFALPGRADDIRSQGCNLLIREKVAEAIISEQDLAMALGLDPHIIKEERCPAEALKGTFSKNVSEDDIGAMSEILRAVRLRRGIGIDELADVTGFGYRRVSELTAMLECEGFISIDLAMRCSINMK